MNNFLSGNSVSVMFTLPCLPTYVSRIRFPHSDCSMIFILSLYCLSPPRHLGNTLCASDGLTSLKSSLTCQLSANRSCMLCLYVSWCLCICIPWQNNNSKKEGTKVSVHAYQRNWIKLPCNLNLKVIFKFYLLLLLPIFFPRLCPAIISHTLRLFCFCLVWFAPLAKALIFICLCSSFTFFLLLADSYASSTSLCVCFLPPPPQPLWGQLLLFATIASSCYQTLAAIRSRLQSAFAAVTPQQLLPTLCAACSLLLVPRLRWRILFAWNCAFCAGNINGNLTFPLIVIEKFKWLSGDWQRCRTATTCPALLLLLFSCSLVPLFLQSFSMVSPTDFLVLLFSLLILIFFSSIQFGKLREFDFNILKWV